MNMKHRFTDKEIRAIEKQLSCPSGDMGIEVGERMNASNMGMTLNTLKVLGIQDGHIVLELGHGNCGHLENLLNSAKDISYIGLEVSELMYQEAQRINHAFLAHNQASFALYDGEHIPYPDNHFDRILTVNTLYFWKNPPIFFRELERVLKPDGICVLTFALKSFMKQLAFVGERFTLFDQEDIRSLVKGTSLKAIEFVNHTDHVISKSGEEVDRHYTMAKLQKCTSS